MAKLEEKKRRELVNQSKSGRDYASKEGNRFKRRLKCSLPGNSSAYENIDMNKLFKDDILEAKINVKGETDTYEVIISFQGVLEELKQLLEERGPGIKLNMVLRAVIRAFDRNDIYIHCSCEDFKYRFAFWATIDRYNSGDLEMRSTDETNPHGDLGSCCKHALLVLNKQIWIIKVASVINNYIRYMRLRNVRLYDKFIAPALFGKKGEPKEPVKPNVDDNQLSFFDNEPEQEEKPEQPVKDQRYQGDNKEESDDEDNI